MEYTENRFVFCSYRKQRTKVHTWYNQLNEIISDVPQGSILGPLLFIMHIFHMFYENRDLDTSSYANDNTP